MYKKVIRQALEKALSEDLEIQVTDIKATDDLFLIGMDSINVIRLIVQIEDIIGVEFWDSEIQRDNWQTIECINEMIIKKVSKNNDLS